MKDYKSEQIRNVAFCGHGRSGKTSLLEAALFDSGATTRLGNVDAGTGVLDFEPEENKRKMSISASLAALEWKNFKINALDVPGFPDFVAEMHGALAAADAAVIVVSASAGVEVETEKAWALAESLNLPRAFFITKMDREHADFEKVLAELRNKFGNSVVPVQVPVGKEDSFKGVVDLIKVFGKVNNDDEACDAAEVADEVEDMRLEMLDTVAEFNDDLMEKYLEGDVEDLDEKEISEALAQGVSEAKVFPVFVGSALKNIGVKKFLNSVVEFFPAPDSKDYSGINPKTDELVERKVSEPFSGQIFKTMVDPFVGRMSYVRVISGDMKGDATYQLIGAENEGQERLSGLFTMQGKKQIPVDVAHAGDIVVTSKLANAKTGDTLCDKAAPIKYERIQYPEPMLAMAVTSEKKGEEDKVFGAIIRQQDEDPTIWLVKNAETKQTILKGVGEVHLDILSDKIQRKFGVKMVLGEPRVAYRETIRKNVEVQGKHKKQSGGHGQYGDVWLKIGPNKDANPEVNNGNVWTESIFGGSVPRQYFPAVEKGTQETLAEGVIAGYPVVNVSVNLFDGSYHAVDSSEAAFKMATSIAIKKGILSADPILLEPIDEITVLTPENYMGDIIGKLNSKRGKILGMDPKGKGMTEVKALIPSSELYKYATDLRSQTQGRASYSLKFSHYDPMPDKLAEKIIEEHKAAQEK
ncbi:MAG: elongation factor G [Selenomonadaceae bacterium]|nr:elongation factor G [Selenomonadaceae bacterium]MBQ7493900.1 elongation factor G [Selenomonadaceae bacterium]